MKLKKFKKPQALILFDDRCSFCWRSVNRILSWDKRKVFRFVPIRDEASKRFLKDRYKELKNSNTLILIENCSSPNPKIWIKGRAVMRILWLLGGVRKLPGALCFVPLGLDAIYSFIANRRHRL